MKTKYSFYSIHEIGKRSNQEDSLFPDKLSGQSSSSSDNLFVLCDGMGGHDSGEVASATVCEVLSSTLANTGKKFSEKDFEDALALAYDALDKKDNPESEKKMGTTMNFVKFHEEGCFVAHIGDSRVYHIRPSEKENARIRFVTQDHSLVNDLVAIGELTEEEARFSPQKNIITRAMQPNQARRCKADWTNLTDLRAGDYIYMCSDGMLEVTEDNELANILSMNVADKEKVRILKAATAENKDNHTAFLIHITSVSDEKAGCEVLQEDEPVHTAEPKRKFPKWIWGVITVLIIIILGLCYILFRIKLA